MARQKKKPKRYKYPLPSGNIKKLTQAQIAKLGQKLLEGPKYKKYGLLYNDEKYGLIYKDFFEEAKKFYKNGDIIDAFVILHGLIHSWLENAWSYFRISVSGIDDFAVGQKDWDYKDLVEIFHQLGIVNDSRRKTLLSFNTGRNHAVHHLSHPTKSHKVSRKELGIKFRQGINAHKIAKDVHFNCFFRASESYQKLSKKRKTTKTNKKSTSKNKTPKRRAVKRK